MILRKVFILISIALILSCNKASYIEGGQNSNFNPNNTGSVVFYTYNIFYAPMSVSIDGVLQQANITQCLVSPNVPNCGDAGCLTISYLQPGTHSVIGWYGNTAINGSITITAGNCIKYSF